MDNIILLFVALVAFVSFEVWLWRRRRGLKRPETMAGGQFITPANIDPEKANGAPQNSVKVFHVEEDYVLIHFISQKNEK